MCCATRFLLLDVQTASSGEQCQRLGREQQGEGEGAAGGEGGDGEGEGRGRGADASVGG